ncbi:hypothetical protein Tco_0654999 [Tanacetum coccineum]|uniref:Uncharacterized protein n=1 Tax=Tanacetum coccineum TaxID=301880 RepID=A0ABQ4X5E3_9ASTR
MDIPPYRWSYDPSHSDSISCPHKEKLDLNSWRRKNKLVMDGYSAGYSFLVQGSRYSRQEGDMLQLQRRRYIDARSVRTKEKVEKVGLSVAS